MRAGLRTEPDTNGDFEAPPLSIAGEYHELGGRRHRAVVQSLPGNGPNEGVTSGTYSAGLDEGGDSGQHALPNLHPRLGKPISSGFTAVCYGCPPERSNYTFRSKEHPRFDENYTDSRFLQLGRQQNRVSPFLSYIHGRQHRHDIVPFTGMSAQATALLMSTGGHGIVDLNTSSTPFAHPGRFPSFQR